MRAWISLINKNKNFAILFDVYSRLTTHDDLFTAWTTLRLRCDTTMTTNKNLSQNPFSVSRVARVMVCRGSLSVIANFHVRHVYLTKVDKWNILLLRTMKKDYQKLNNRATVLHSLTWEKLHKGVEKGIT